MNAILGGTFSHLHDGHRALFDAAAKFDEVIVGLTSDGFARKKKGKGIAAFEERKEKLASFLQKNYSATGWLIEEINDRFGPAAKEKPLDAIIVSAETAPIADEINEKRKKAHLPPLKIISIPLALGQDWKKISSNAIAAGITDEKGMRLKPVVLSIGSENKTKLDGARKAASAIFKCATGIQAVPVHSGVSHQPFGEETITGAINRAKAAYGQSKGIAAGGKSAHAHAGSHSGSTHAPASGCDYGIGLESGLFSFAGKHFDIVFCAVYDGNNFTLGNSMGFAIPSAVLARIKKEGKPMGDVISEIAGIQKIGEKGGAINFLSRGMLHRSEMNEQALKCAFIGRMGVI
jgi:inosine/xanthosine triphosphatase